jgi:hypothetical protein
MSLSKKLIPPPPMLTFPWWDHLNDIAYRWDHKFKRRFVAALRGGNWKQIRNSYSYGDEYRCAMGVANEVVAQMYPEKSAGIDRHQLYCLGVPGEVAHFIIFLNDFHRLSFDQIADWVEANDGRTAKALLCNRTCHTEDTQPH